MFATNSTQSQSQTDTGNDEKVLQKLEADILKEVKETLSSFTWLEKQGNPFTKVEGDHVVYGQFGQEIIESVRRLKNASLEEMLSSLVTMLKITHDKLRSVVPPKMHNSCMRIRRAIDIAMQNLECITFENLSKTCSSPQHPFSYVVNEILKKKRNQEEQKSALEAKERFIHYSYRYDEKLDILKEGIKKVARHTDQQLNDFRENKISPVTTSIRQLQEKVGELRAPVDKLEKEKSSLERDLSAVKKIHVEEWVQIPTCQELGYRCHCTSTCGMEKKRNEIEVPDTEARENAAYELEKLIKQVAEAESKFPKDEIATLEYELGVADVQLADLRKTETELSDRISTMWKPSITLIRDPMSKSKSEIERFSCLEKALDGKTGLYKQLAELIPILNDNERIDLLMLIKRLDKVENFKEFVSEKVRNELDGIQIVGTASAPVLVKPQPELPSPSVVPGVEEKAENYNCKALQKACEDVIIPQSETSGEEQVASAPSQSVEVAQPMPLPPVHGVVEDAFEPGLKVPAISPSAPVSPVGMFANSGPEGQERKASVDLSPSPLSVASRESDLDSQEGVPVRAASPAKLFAKKMDKP